MRICYIDDNEEYLNSFKDNFKDVFRENDFTFMQYPNEYIGSDDVAEAAGVRAFARRSI